MSLHTKILLGLVLGAVCGVTANLLFPARPPRVEVASVLAVAPPAAFPATLPWAALAVSSEKPPTNPVELFSKYVTEPVGQIFLRLLIMTVVPLVFASLATGVARLGDLRSLGRVGARTFVYFVMTMSIAVVIGLVLVNAVRPGDGLSEETRDRLRAKYGSEAEQKTAGSPGFGIHTLVNIVPRNPVKAAADMDMLGVIFFALLIGAGLNVIPPERSRLILQLLDGLNDLMVVIINLAMRLAPYGVFALIFTTTAAFGFGILLSLGKFVAVVLIGLALHFFGVFSILVAVFSRLNPLVFFRKVRDVVVTAFSTSSSNATLPTSIKVAEEELGVPPQIAGFVLPLGATMNMNGTALFEGVVVVFLAQVYGVHLGVAEQLIVIVMAVMTAIGAAGVPGGSIPLLAFVLLAVNVPPEGIAIVIGVDRLLDMCRTTLNVVGDITCATYVARSEGYELLKSSQ
jgi:DAACS family dicarboxylate/amino acid:cation (Na+ or H+) symporter